MGARPVGGCAPPARRVTKGHGRRRRKSRPPTGTDAGAFVFGVRIAFTLGVRLRHRLHLHRLRRALPRLRLLGRLGDAVDRAAMGGSGAGRSWSPGSAPGTALIETAVAVALSSVRFLPIVVALLPLVKRENARPWQLLVPAHFMAVSVWVEAMRHAPGLPREHRIPFCNGFGVTLLGARRRRSPRSATTCRRCCRRCSARPPCSSRRSRS